MVDRPDPAPQSDAEGGRIVAELPCRDCRYTLIGCSIADRCPECGLPVEASLHASIDLETIDGSALPNPRLVSAAAGLLAIATLIWAFGSTLFWVSDTATMFDFSTPFPRTTPWFVTAFSLAWLVAAMLLFRQARTGWPGMASGMAVAAIFLGGTAAILVTVITPSVPDPVAMILRSIVMVLLVLGLCDVMDRAGRRALAYRQAGTAIQTRTPLLLAIAVEMLASPMGDSEIARILGLTASALVLIGTIYLVANSFWATLPLLREKHRYRDLVSSRMQPKRD